MPEPGDSSYILDVFARGLESGEPIASESITIPVRAVVPVTYGVTGVTAGARVSVAVDGSIVDSCVAETCVTLIEEGVDLEFLADTTNESGPRPVFARWDGGCSGSTSTASAISIDGLECFAVFEDGIECPNPVADFSIVEGSNVDPELISISALVSEGVQADGRNSLGEEPRTYEWELYSIFQGGRQLISSHIDDTTDVWVLPADAPYQVNRTYEVQLEFGCGSPETQDVLVKGFRVLN